LQWFGDVKRMDGMKMLRRALKLKFTEHKLMGTPRTKWFSQVSEDSKKKR
jgi:hypothetical protein